MNKPRLLVSVFSEDEARSAVQGGADIVDCEDPRADVGMYAPRDITNIIHAVRQAEGSNVVRTSVNIGASLQLFTRVATGMAVPRTGLENQARAAQEALGCAAAMDIGDTRSNIVKFGVDGIHADHIVDLVRAVKRAIRESSRYQNYQVIGSFLPIDMAEWNNRKGLKPVITQLLNQGVYYFTKEGSIDLTVYFPDKDYPGRVKQLMKAAGVDQPNVNLIEPFAPADLGFDDDLEKRTRQYVELIVKGEADGIMIDTPVQAKAARICLLQHPQNASDGNPPLYGLYSVDLLTKYVNLCEFMGVEAWVAGSIQPYHAVELGKLEHLDVVLCRGAASDVVTNPYGGSAGDDRSSKRISAKKVAMMAAALRGKMVA